MSKYRIKLDGTVYEMEVEKMEEGAMKVSALTCPKSVAAGSTNVRVSDPALRQETVDEGNVVHSPMPGTVIKIFHQNGEKVEKGQPVLVLEAMKMENEIAAPKTGIIDGLTVQEKTSVQGGDVLFTVIEE